MPSDDIQLCSTNGARAGMAAKVLGAFPAPRRGGATRLARADFCKPLPGRTVRPRPSATREDLFLSSRRVRCRA